MLGLMLGMSLTAQADELPYAKLKNTVTVVKFDNKDWYLTDYDEKTVTLISKKCVAESKFNTADKGNKYSGSIAEETVNNYYKKNISADAKTAVNLDKMFLLSKKQAGAITNKAVMRAVDPDAAYPNYWWLQSPGNDGESYVACVDSDEGEIDGDGQIVTDNNGVRPAIQLNLSDVTFLPEVNTFALEGANTRDIEKVIAMINALPASDKVAVFNRLHIQDRCEE